MRSVLDAIWIVALYAVLLCFLALTGCKSQTPLVQVRESVTHDTVRVERVDSVYVARYVRERNDTVWLTDSVVTWRVRWRDRVERVEVHDSIPYEVTVQVPVRMRNGYDRFVSWGFWLFFTALIARVGWWLFRTFYLRK